MLVGLFVRHDLYDTLSTDGSLHRKRRVDALPGFEPRTNVVALVPNKGTKPTFAVGLDMYLLVLVPCEREGDDEKSSSNYQDKISAFPWIALYSH